MSKTPKQIKKGFEFEHGVVEGYGGPGYSWVNLIYDNRLLGHYEGSDRGVGKFEAKMEIQWIDKEWTEEALQEAIKGMPQARSLCDHCSKPCKGSTILLGSKHYCQACDTAGIVDRLQQELRAKHQTEQEKRDKQISDQKAQNEKEMKLRVAEAKDAFHWKDNWFWKRCADGSVMLTHIEGTPLYNNEEIRQQLIIPADEWASIIASVSQQGESGNGWERAKTFHNAQIVQH